MPAIINGSAGPGADGRCVAASFVSTQIKLSNLCDLLQVQSSGGWSSGTVLVVSVP